MGVFDVFSGWFRVVPPCMYRTAHMLYTYVKPESQHRSLLVFCNFANFYIMK